MECSDRSALVVQTESRDWVGRHQEIAGFASQHGLGFLGSANRYPVPKAMLEGLSYTSVAKQ
jgi:hypothetical protein